jgi:NitT/TauT family transport system substrate-binding protein
MRPNAAQLRLSTKSSLILIAAALTAGLLAISSARAETIHAGKAFPTAFGFVPLDIGVREGIFKKYGLDVEITSFGGAPMLVQAVTAGSIDIGLDGGSDIAMIAKGLPGKGVGALGNAPLEITIVAAPDTTMKTIADLKGRKISVSQISTLTGWLVSELSRQQGWGVEGINRVASGNAGLSNLMAGDVDGFTIDLSTALQLERQGRGKLFLKFGDYVKDFHAYVFIAHNDLMAKRPDTLRAFLKAWYETIAFMRANKAKAVAIAAEVQHADPDIASGTYDVMMSSFSTDGKFSAKALDLMARSFVDLGVVDKAPDPTTLVTEAFLPR